MPVIVGSVGNPVPAPFDLRTREVGGGECLANPGVTAGRGALNVGLRVRVQGMVTAIDPNNQWFYIWDGANDIDQPVSDGSGNIGVVSTDASIVAGQIAPTIVPTAISKVTQFETISTPANDPFVAGWNLIGVPAAPASTGDGDEWSAKPWDGYMVFPPDRDPNGIDGRLYRWESCTGSLSSWDMWSEVNAHGPFGGMLLGDGYWLQIDEDWPVSYSGRSSSLDQWIGVCRPGWMIIGHPKDHPTLLDDVEVHAGDRIVSMRDAIFTEAWVDCIGYWWDEDSRALVDIGIDDCWASMSTLMPWHGYWMLFFRGDISLIVPESPEAPALP